MMARVLRQLDADIVLAARPGAATLHGFRPRGREGQEHAYRDSSRYDGLALDTSKNHFLLQFALSAYRSRLLARDPEQIVPPRGAHGLTPD
jgi:hypothetical protein